MQTIVQIGGIQRTVSLLYDVIVTYLNYLSYLGFLSSFHYSQAGVLKTHSLIPPNSSNAERLEAAIRAVDGLDPAVDSNIHGILTPEEKRPDPKTVLVNYAEELERRKEHAEKVYRVGFSEIKDRDFNTSSRVMDTFGFRWLICKKCGEICREDLMASFGGSDGLNRGICKKCLP